ncbi:MAG: S1 RNA-binding domain-containing protein [Oscillospiraceae bacterium]|nr:S1 RNA-binding domain-containing protein [Oscillospiraceae bacterium]
MELTVGTVLEGKVKSITNFGAFIALPENKTGMVHISEVANAYVSDIRQHLTEGQDVKVVIIGNENGKINLSIKRLQPREPRENGPRQGGFRGNHQGGHTGAPRQQGHTQSQNRPQRPAPVPPAAPKTADQLFEEKLKAFMSESDSKLSSIRADHRTKNRRR